MKWLECRIPPLIVLAICTGLSWSISIPATAIELPNNLANSASILFSLAALHFMFSSAIKFIRANTSMSPISPEKAESLVTQGTYSMSRNPMYVGMLFLQLSFACYLSNLLAFAPAILFIIFIHRFQIIPEQRWLTEKFGQPYLDYCQKVRPWL